MKGLLSIILITTTFLPTLATAQQANTLNLKGKVIGKTCDVSINGDSVSPVVVLPIVSSTELITAGQTAGDTDFSIDIKNCQQGYIAKAWIYTISSQNGNVINIGGTATNVEIQILDGATSNPISLSHATSTVTIDSNMRASIPLTARYYSTANTTAGSVIGTALYIMQYN